MGDTGESVNLTARREEFLETFFRKGAEFSAELITEVQDLRKRVGALTEENADLRHQMASDDAIKDLLKTIEALEKDKHALRNRALDAARETRDYSSRYSEVERELDNLANLYVASYQLHGTLETREVLSVIEQLLCQLVGAARFAIYLRRDADGESLLEPVHSYHCDRVNIRTFKWNEGPIGETAATQVHFVADPRASVPGSPIACIPMVLGQKTVGVLAIFELFEQKEGFVPVDFELFKLLACHAASAIVGAGLFARAGSVSAGLEGYQRL